MRFLYFICFFFALIKSYGQSPTDAISFSNLNTKYLEHLVKEQVDSVRIAHGLKTLANDSILYVASKYHADYLIKNKKLTHNQNGVQDKKYPQDRANFFGAKNYLVGENLAKTYALKPVKDKKGNIHTNETYIDVAREFAKLWVNSPGHYKNMITPSYEITGVSIGYDPEKKEIKTVQKFAEVMFLYEFKENKEMFPFSSYSAVKAISSFNEVKPIEEIKKYPFGIKRPSDSLVFCKECNEAIDTVSLRNKIQIKGKKIVFTSPNLEMMYAILGKYKNGLALEFVEYLPYDCGNEQYYTNSSRRNKQSLITGRVIHPVYRKDLKKGFKKTQYKWFYRIKKKNDAQYFEYTLGKIPKDLKGYVEINVLVLKQNKLCRVMHLTDWCGIAYDKFEEIPYLTKLNDYKYNDKGKEETLSFTIPFEQGKFSYEYTDIKPLIDSLTSESFTVSKASIKAYSSLEGSEEINQDLQLKRSNSIVKAFENHQRATVEAKVTTQPNWSLFERQIATSKELKALKGLSREEVLVKLQNRAYAIEIEPFLKEQRIAEVILTIRTDILDENMGEHLVGVFNNHLGNVQAELKSNGLTKTAKLEMDTIAGVQWYLYHLIKNHKVDSTFFLKIEVPQTIDYARLVKDNLWYKLDIYGEGDQRWEKEFYNKLNKLDRLGISSFEIRFDVTNYLVKSWSKRAPFGGDIQKLEDMIDGLYGFAYNDSTKGMIPLLKSNFYFKAANYFHFDKPSRNDEKMREILEKLYTFYEKRAISDEEVYKLAEFFTYCEQEDLAYDILMPRVSKEKAYGPNLVLFFKLTYQHSKEFSVQQYYDDVLELKNKLSTEEWCGMFVGPCNISFQSFDYEPLRSLYCKECSEFKNFGQKPEECSKH